MKGLCVEHSANEYVCTRDDDGFLALWKAGSDVVKVMGSWQGTTVRDSIGDCATKYAVGNSKCGVRKGSQRTIRVVTTHVIDDFGEEI